MSFGKSRPEEKIIGAYGVPKRSPKARDTFDMSESLKAISKTGGAIPNVGRILLTASQRTEFVKGRTCAGKDAR